VPTAGVDNAAMIPVDWPLASFGPRRLLASPWSTDFTSGDALHAEGATPLAGGAEAPRFFPFLKRYAAVCSAASANVGMSNGVVRLPVDAIAALAGCSRTTAQNALRQARKLGLILVKERRIPGQKSLPNVIRVISRDWLAWLERGIGFKKIKPLG